MHVKQVTSPCLLVFSWLFIACYMTPCISVWFLCMNWWHRMTYRSAVLLDVIAVSALIIYVTRVALGYKQTWDRYQVSSSKFTSWVFNNYIQINQWPQSNMGCYLLGHVCCIIYLSLSFTFKSPLWQFFSCMEGDSLCAILWALGVCTAPWILVDSVEDTIDIGRVWRPLIFMWRGVPMGQRIIWPRKELTAKFWL